MVYIILVYVAKSRESWIGGVLRCLAELHGPYRIKLKIIYHVRMGLLNAWTARIESGGFLPDKRTLYKP